MDKLKPKWHANGALMMHNLQWQLHRSCCLEYMLAAASTSHLVRNNEDLHWHDHTMWIQCERRVKHNEFTIAGDDMSICANDLQQSRNIL